MKDLKNKETIKMQGLLTQFIADRVNSNVWLGYVKPQSFAKIEFTDEELLEKIEELKNDGYKLV